MPYIYSQLFDNSVVELFKTKMCMRGYNVHNIYLDIFLEKKIYIYNIQYIYYI